jgi:hypothetical protein
MAQKDAFPCLRDVLPDTVVFHGQALEQCEKTRGCCAGTFRGIRAWQLPRPPADPT